MDSIQNRRSIRKYKPDPVDDVLIRQIVEAGTLAPSAKNRQPWKFIVCKGEAKEKVVSAMEKGLDREKSGDAVLPNSANCLGDAYNTLRVMEEAPVLIIVLNTNGDNPYEPINTDRRISEICDSLSIGAAIENMLLKAQELGLGTLWIANTCFAYPELIETIGTSSQLVSAIALGYADEAPEARPRKPLDEVLEYMN